MERDWNDFKAIYANMPGARDAFEKACETLFRKVHEDKNVKQVSVKRGDGGLDVFVGELGVEPIISYQCKFFLDELGAAQHQQIQSSFKTAIESKEYEMEKWILCLPRTLNKEESLWWSEWRKKQIAKYSLKENMISLKNGNELIDLMKSNELYEIIFKIDELILAKDTNKKVTKLIESFEPSKGTLPKIRWSTFIGKQKWKNTPVIIGENLYVGSAGEIWNESDSSDGVYCLDALTGGIKWFFQTDSDVNELAVYEGNVVGGCDNGLVFCISAKNGNCKWVRKLTSGIVSKIYKTIGFESESLIVVTYNGDITFLDFVNGEILNSVKLGHSILGNVQYVNTKYNSKIYVPTLAGKIFQLSLSFNDVSEIKVFDIEYPDQYSVTGFSQASIYSTPLIIDTKIYIGIVRQTSHDYPAIVCINTNSGEIDWYASDHSKKCEDYGNVRTNIITFKNELLFVHPYSNEIGGINQGTGEINWLTSLGRPMFQQWSSPIVYNDAIYIARYDGYLYKVNGLSKEREWGIYLGEESDAGIVYDKDQPISNENEQAAWELYKGKSILSTPSIGSGKIFVGTDEGYLYCIENI